MDDVEVRIVRVSHDQVVVPLDINLSLGAQGLLVWIMAREEPWTVDGLIATLGKRAGVEEAIAELVERGHVLDSEEVA